MNKLKIFDNQVTDAESLLFSPNVTDAKNFPSLDSYFELYGSLGGGTIKLEKLAGDGVTWLTLTQDTLDMAANFPGINALSIQSSDAVFRISLTGVVGASLSGYAYNVKEV